MVERQTGTKLTKEKLAEEGQWIGPKQLTVGLAHSFPPRLVPPWCRSVDKTCTNIINKALAGRITTVQRAGVVLLNYVELEQAPAVTVGPVLPCAAHMGLLSCSNQIYLATQGVILQSNALLHAGGLDCRVQAQGAQSGSRVY